MNTQLPALASAVYAVAAMSVRSDLVLPGRVLTEALATDCSVQVVQHLDQPPTAWLPSNGDITWWEARSETGWWLRVDGVATVHVAPDDRVIEVQPDPDGHLDVVAELVVNAVIPTLLGLIGNVVIHATAVNLAGRAVAFAGASMAGKSSMTAALASLGNPVLADDCLRVEQREGTAVVIPTANAARLRADTAARLSGLLSLTNDPRRDVDPPQPVPLQRVCLLQRGKPELAIEPVGPATAAAALVPHLYFGRCSARPSWELVGRLVNAIEGVQVVRLSYPDDLEWLLSHRQQLAEVLGR